MSKLWEIFLSQRFRKDVLKLIGWHILNVNIFMIFNFNMFSIRVQYRILNDAYCSCTITTKSCAGDVDPIILESILYPNYLGTFKSYRDILCFGMRWRELLRLICLVHCHETRYNPTKKQTLLVFSYYFLIPQSLNWYMHKDKASLLKIS